MHNFLLPYLPTYLISMTWINSYPNSEQLPFEGLIPRLGQARAGRIWIFYFIRSQLMSCQEWTDGDEAVQEKNGFEFWEFRRGRGGMNFCLGRGCLVDLRSADYLVNGCKKEAFREW